MKPIDFGKAALAGLRILVLNLLATTAQLAGELERREAQVLRVL